VFTHQLIQEYFASEVLGEKFDEGSSSLSFFKIDEWWLPNGWEETAIILAGVRGASQLEEIVKWIGEAQPEVAIRCINESGIPGLTINSISITLKNHLRKIWEERLIDKTESINARMAIGRALGAIGDLRKGIGIKNGLPQISWCKISTSGKKISKYPITNSQFDSFVVDRDYDELKWWSTEGKEWKKHNKSKYHSTVSNYPVTNVTWFEAEAFCSWLSSKMSKQIRLPTYNEWLNAAYGEKKREYPWGNKFNPDYLNIAIEENESNRICSVGIFPKSRSYNGVEDMLGNVWEWCYDKSPVNYYPEKLNLEKATTHILVGGAFDKEVDYVKRGYQYWSYPDFHRGNIGFRILCVSN
ncbi:MAG: SUMF1/EgtB/PvdO family nonheme iron enzyme, partial [Flavobacteriaceae bacterium]|nr:SUMF1/EgtB/PvdO family nonheme iron enzyme [Flavobacteriaceae bacterium]